MKLGAARGRFLSRLGRFSWFGAKELLRRTRFAMAIKDRLDLVEALDFTADDLEENRRCLRRAETLRDTVRTVHWYVPYFEYAFYGGVHTILRFATGLLERHGVRSDLVFYDRPSVPAGQMKAKVVEAFPALREVEVHVLQSAMQPVPPADASIATFWTSAYAVLKNRNSARKFYFIQDYEPLFYPAGTYYALVEATYRFGFPGIVNTPGLCELYRRDFGAPAIAFTPATDPQLFHPPAVRQVRPFRVFFYGRPETDRNAFEIGIAALRRLKQRHGADVDVVVAGSDVPPEIAYGAPGLRFIGRIPYRETGDLYRQCDAGLVLMLTKHPSYLPFELMSCGAVPVANVNSANAWLLRHEETALVAEPSPSLLLDALERLLRDAALRQRLSAAGQTLIRGFTWDEQIDRVLRFMQGGGEASTRAPPTTEPGARR
ncbi:MAG: glycosyltransferase family 4 protein [Myxococcales bacterium]